MWLLAAVLLEQTVSVPASGVRALDLTVRKEVAAHSWADHRGRPLMEIRFAVTQPGPEVRVALLAMEEGRKLRRGMSHGVLSALSYREAGVLRHLVESGQSYTLALDNRLEGRTEANVQVTVSLISGDGPAREASPMRRLLVIAASTAFFVGLTVWAARRLLDVTSRGRPTS